MCRLSRLQDADGDAVLGAGIVHDDGAVALAHQLAELEVDLLVAAAAPASNSARLLKSTS